jgi:hypothetical protein
MISLVWINMAKGRKCKHNMVSRKSIEFLVIVWHLIMWSYALLNLSACFLPWEMMKLTKSVVFKLWVCVQRLWKNKISDS